MHLFQRLKFFCQQQLYAEYHSWPNWIILSFLAGVVTYFLLSHDPNLPLITSLASFLSCTAFITYFRHKSKGWWILLLAAAIFMIGLWRATSVADRIIPVSLVKEEIYTTIIGKVDGIELKPNYQRITISQAVLQDKAAFMVKVAGKTLGRRPMPGTIRVTTRIKAQVPLRIGDTVKVRAKLNEPPLPIVPGSYDARRACFFRDIKLVGIATSVAEVIAPAAPSWRDYVADLRLQLAAAINAKMGPRFGNLTSGLMLGMASAIDRDIVDAMRNTGLAHILAVSGLHMTVVCGCVFLALRVLFAPLLVLMRLNVVKLAAAVSMAASGIYLLLTGIPVAALRAWLMSCGFMVGVIMDRPTAILRLLGVAAVVIVWRQPVAAMEPSFQMSFAAVLGLITSYSVAARKTRELWKGYNSTDAKWWHKAAQNATGMMISTIIASCATAPFAIYHFHRQPLWGSVSNLVAIPLTTMVIMPLIVVTLIAYPLGLFEWGLVLLTLPIKALAGFALYVEGLGEEIIVWPHVSPVAMTLIVMGGLWWSCWRQKWRLVGLPIMVLGYVMVRSPADNIILYDWRKNNYAIYKGGTIYVSNPRAGRMVKGAWQAYTGANKISRITDANLEPEEGVNLTNQLTQATQACKLEVEKAKLAFSTLMVGEGSVSCANRKWQQ